MNYRETPIHSIYKGFVIRHYDTDGISAWRWVAFATPGVEITADTLAELKWNIKNSVFYA
jgi:hypothetical protein